MTTAHRTSRRWMVTLAATAVGAQQPRRRAQLRGRGPATLHPARSSVRTPRPAPRSPCGASTVPATRPSRASRPTSASTSAAGSTSRSRPTRRPTPSTSTGWATTAATAPGKIATVARHGDPPADPARRASPTPSTELRRLRQLGASARPGPSRPTPSPASTSRDLDARRHRRRQPHPLRRARRRQPLGHRLPDLRHDLAGLQQLRRRQPLHRASNRPRAYKVSYNRPVQHRRRRRTVGDFLFSQRVPDDPVPRAQRLRRQLHQRASTPTAAARCCSTTRSSSRSATTSTGRAASAPTSRRRATPA